jgi:hypothetical protein
MYEVLLIISRVIGSFVAKLSLLCCSDCSFLSVLFVCQMRLVLSRCRCRIMFLDNTLSEHACLPGMLVEVVNGVQERFPTTNNT